MAKQKKKKIKTIKNIWERVRKPMPPPGYSWSKKDYNRKDGKKVPSDYLPINFYKLCFILYIN